MPHGEDIGVGDGGEQGRRASRLGREESGEPRKTRVAFGMPGREPGEFPLALDRGRPRALGEDHGDLAGAETARHLFDALHLAGHPGGRPVDEPIGEPSSDDVETRVEGQFLLEHVARPQVGEGSEHPRRDERIGEAGMAAQGDERTAPRAVGALDVDAQPGGDPQGSDEVARPPSLQGEMRPLIAGLSGAPQHDRHRHARHLEPGPAQGERQEPEHRQSPSTPDRIENGGDGHPHGHRDEEDHRGHEHPGHGEGTAQPGRGHRGNVGRDGTAGNPPTVRDAGRWAWSDRVGPRSVRPRREREGRCSAPPSPARRWEDGPPSPREPRHTADRAGCPAAPDA